MFAHQGECEPGACITPILDKQSMQRGRAGHRKCDGQNPNLIPSDPHLYKISSPWVLAESVKVIKIPIPIITLCYMTKRILWVLLRVMIHWLWVYQETNYRIGHEPFQSSTRAQRQEGRESNHERDLALGRFSTAGFEDGRATGQGPWASCRSSYLLLTDDRRDLSLASTNNESVRNLTDLGVDSL